MTHPRDLREPFIRQVFLIALTDRAKQRAQDALADLYAEAIRRNGRLRARFRRARKTWGGDWGAWYKRGNPSLGREFGWTFAAGRAPHCYVSLPQLEVGLVAAATKDQRDQVAFLLHDHRGDLPCCVCPATCVTMCLTHFELYHTPHYRRCFRCDDHPAASRHPTLHGVSAPLWGGRREVAVRPPGQTRVPVCLP